MTDTKDLSYYIRRESSERENARTSTDISARIAHLTAAKGYAARIASLTSQRLAGA